MNKRIEIIGNIASGRTSLAMFTKKYNYSVVYEDFLSHPFLKSFYEDKNRFAFETEILFLMQHFYDIKTKISNTTNICDFSFYLDDIFAVITLDKNEYKAFKYVNNVILTKIGKPDLVIYTRCNPTTSLERIKNRNREFEQNIDILYLETIYTSIEKYLVKIENLIIIDTDKDIFSTAYYKEDTINTINTAINNL